MDPYYKINVKVFDYNEDREKEIIEAVGDCMDYIIEWKKNDDLKDETNDDAKIMLEIHGEKDAVEVESEEDDGEDDVEHYMEHYAEDDVDHYVEHLTKDIWRANDAYCRIEIDATFNKITQFELDEEVFNKWMKESDVPTEQRRIFCG